MEKRREEKKYKKGMRNCYLSSSPEFQHSIHSIPPLPTYTASDQPFSTALVAQVSRVRSLAEFVLRVELLLRTWDRWHLRLLALVVAVNCICQLCAVPVIDNDHIC